MSFDFWTKEAIYDEQIAPLMTQIIAICKEHELPMVAQFQYANTEEDGPAYCSTALTFAEASEHIRNIAARLRPAAPVCLAETHITNPDGSKLIKIQRIS